MRKLYRLGLSQHALSVLEKKSSSVAMAADSKQEIERLWRIKNNKTFREIREKLNQMASGVNFCMYCEANEGSDIDHFDPKSRNPAKAFQWQNYILACASCNSNYKRIWFPQDRNNQSLLLDPSLDDPKEHLVLSLKTGKVGAFTLKGRYSRCVFGLNRFSLVRGRFAACLAVQGLLALYADAQAQGKIDQANEFRQAVCHHPFASVLESIIDSFTQLPTTRLLAEPCRQALEQYPEIKDWLKIDSGNYELLQASLPSLEVANATEMFDEWVLDFGSSSFRLVSRAILNKSRGLQVTDFNGLIFEKAEATGDRTKLFFSKNTWFTVAHDQPETMYLLEDGIIKGVW